ncbi:hypothetical protein A6P54_12915 [Bacillus sp. MKU004]|nr:hypothetical protein A6P54_12915 [Bacillus sp. MKU004]
MKVNLEVFQYEFYLNETNFNNLQQCIFSYRQEQFFASAVWGAVFLEGFLADLVDELKIKSPGSKDLYTCINILNQVPNMSLAEPINVPNEIPKRADEIRLTRNRLVHDTGFSKESLETDANSIVTHLKILLEWYMKNFSPKYRQLDEEEEISQEDLIPVFMSTITADTEAQKYFLELFSHKLRKLGIDPIKVTMDEYDSKDPMGKIRSVMEECKAVIVIGLERSHAYFLRDRVGSPKQQDRIHTKYSSGWLHLEAGMANALNKEMFVLCQSDVCSDGVFDRNWNTYPVLEFEFDKKDIKSISNMFSSPHQSLNTFFRRIEKWVEKERSM